MKTEIINVGDEILSGSTLNRNVQILSKKRLEIGIKVDFNTTVGDVEEDIVFVTNLALERSNLIIYTGGLGPTRDDFTKEVVCKVIDRKLNLDEDILKSIKAFFKSRGLEMTNNNNKQACVPKGSTVLKNENGTAPGFLLEHKKSIIVLLPGPPREVGPMFERKVIPIIKDSTTNNIVSRTIKTIGIGESSLEAIIDHIISHYRTVDIATYARSGQVDILIKMSSDDEVKAYELINEICEEINKEIKEYIYSYDNETIEEVVLKLLKDNNFKIGFCESCTGGLATSKITQPAGASSVLDRSVVTYSNKAKIEEVGVSKLTLDKYGAVSSETAIEMAKGLLNKADIDIAVSITGLAGPGGETDTKPVGLVYICLATKTNHIVVKNIFKGSRNYVQERSCLEALNLIRKHILTDSLK